MKLSCWEVYEFNFVPKYVPENPKNTDQNDANGNGGAMQGSPAGRFPNITVVLSISKVYINWSYPILVLTTVLNSPRRADSLNVCKNGVENYQ